MSGISRVVSGNELAKKRRFASLEDRELDGLLDSAQSKKTKYSTIYVVGVYNEWAKQRKIEKQLHELSDEELDATLRLFYAEARSKDGEDYGKSTLLGFRNGIERYLNYPPHNRGIKFNKNPLFKSSNLMLDAKIRNLKQLGKENAKHKPAVVEEDLRKLKDHSTISLSTPLGLLRNVWFHTTLYWCRRGQEGQRNLKKSSFIFTRDENNRAYATMSHDESTKNHPGGIADDPSFQKDGRMYQTDHPSDGYNSLQLYILKLNPICEAFYQYPKRKWNPNDLSWYENRPLGINKLGVMMKEISKSAGLSQDYTNHCLRATAITLWSNAGLTNRHIMAISGHRNEHSLKNYNARPSSAQLKESSDVLTSALISSDPKSLVVAEGRQHHVQGQTISQMKSTSLSSSVENFSFNSMFSSCSIGSVQVFVNPSHGTDVQQ